MVIGSDRAAIVAGSSSASAFGGCPPLPQAESASATARTAKGRIDQRIAPP
jgi:hypothetical protein